MAAALLVGWPVGLMSLSGHATRTLVLPAYPMLSSTRGCRRSAGCVMLDEENDWPREIGQRMGQETRMRQAMSSFLRVGLPTVGAFLLGLYNFDNLSLFIRSTQEIDSLRMVLLDDAQFVQNFLTVTDLLLAILAGNIYDSLYRQQEAIYFSLFREVSEAKALLEQLTLLGQARPFYTRALRCMQRYVDEDLRRLDVAPQQLLAIGPQDDPLEEIFLLTSIGVPSVLYESLRDLRQARGERLGAMQVKFPNLGINLLYLLAGFELMAFPLLGAGTLSEYGPLELLPEAAQDNVSGVLSVQAFLFACLCGCFVLVLRIIQELRQSSGGVFNVDDVLQQMVSGLEDELELRLSQAISVSSTADRQTRRDAL